MSVKAPEDQLRDKGEGAKQRWMDCERPASTVVCTCISLIHLCLIVAHCVAVTMMSPARVVEYAEKRFYPSIQ